MAWSQLPARRGAVPRVQGHGLCSLPRKPPVEHGAGEAGQRIIRLNLGQGLGGRRHGDQQWPAAVAERDQLERHRPWERQSMELSAGGGHRISQGPQVR